MYQVKIRWCGAWWPVGPAVKTREAANALCLQWGRDCAGRIASIVERLDIDDEEYVTLDSVLGRGRHQEDSGCDLGNMPK